MRFSVVLNSTGIGIVLQRAAKSDGVMDLQNILIIKLRHIGDVLLSTPVLRGLRTAFPLARLTMLVNRGTEGVLAHNPDVNEVLCLEKGSLKAQLKFVQMLRQRAFDGVVDLTDGDRSAVIGLATGAPVRIGFNAEHRWRGLLYSTVAKPRQADQHRVDYDLCALRALGLDTKPGTPALYPSPTDEQTVEAWMQEAGLLSAQASPLLVLLQPGARYSLKVWPHERFAQLADRLADRFVCRILLGGDQREREVAEQVARKTRCAPIVVAGKFSPCSLPRWSNVVRCSSETTVAPCTLPQRWERRLWLFSGRPIRNGGAARRTGAGDLQRPGLPGLLSSDLLARGR